jgi:electron transfer flavoprotein alpha subunit
VTGVERFFIQDDRPCFTRSICNGKIVVDVSPNVETAVLTIQPGYWKAASFIVEKAGNVDMQSSSHKPQQSRSLEIIHAKEENSALSEADVIVSAGRGISKKENLELVERLAALFPKSAVGGSRPVCDSGWMEYKRQVGLTGATVAPKLYIACGISGASQHLAGMRGSGFIVAINTDPAAAILNTADVYVVEDLATFIPAFIEEFNKSKD